MSTQAGKGRGRGYEKGKSPRNSRRPAPAKSRLTSTGPAKGGPAHETRAHLQPGQCLLCRQMGHMARDCPNRGMRDDSGINLERAFGSFVGMTGEVSSLFFFYEAGYHDDSTTGSRARLRIHYVSRARCNLAVSFIYLGGYHGPRDQRQNAVVVLERRRNQRQLQPHLQHGSEHHIQ